MANYVQLLLDSTDEGIYGIDLQARCTLINRSGARLVGYRPDQLLGKNLHQAIHHSRPDGSTYPVDECPVVRAFRIGQGVRIDSEVFWRRDGTSFAVEYSSYPIVEDGVVRGAVVTFVDITQRKRAEDERARLASEQAKRVAAEAGRQQVSNVLESITDAFFALDHDWRFTYLNKEAERLLRRRRKELTGSSLWDVFPEAVGSTFYEEYHRAMAEQSTVTFEEFYPPLSAWFEVHAYPSSDGLSVYFRDTSHRKQAELFREPYISIVSHDLRSPPTVIRGQAQLIERFADQPPLVHKSAAAIVTSAQRMNAMIRDLLDSARLEAGQVLLEKKPLDLKACLTELLERAGAALETSRVEVAIAEGLPLVLADPDRLERILMNLLTNALKYSSPETALLVTAKRTG